MRPREERRSRSRVSLQVLQRTKIHHKVTHTLYTLNNNILNSKTSASSMTSMVLSIPLLERQNYVGLMFYRCG